MPDFEDDEAYELRVARRQWMSPDKKEKVMGAVKQMLLGPKAVGFSKTVDILCRYPLIGFGEASFMDIEIYLGFPSVHPDHLNGGSLGMAQTPPWDLRCAWGITWDDGQSVVIHDYNSVVNEVEDLKHWHITGSRDAWARLMEGYVVDPEYVRLTEA